MDDFVFRMTRNKVGLSIQFTCEYGVTHSHRHKHTRGVTCYLGAVCIIKKLVSWPGNVVNNNITPSKPVNLLI